MRRSCLRAEHPVPATSCHRRVPANGTGRYRTSQTLESIRDEPEFINIVAELNAEMSGQLENVRKWEAAGELAPIPDDPVIRPE